VPLWKFARAWVAMCECERRTFASSLLYRSSVFWLIDLCHLSQKSFPQKNIKVNHSLMAPQATPAQPFEPYPVPQRTLDLKCDSVYLRIRLCVRAPPSKRFLTFASVYIFLKRPQTSHPLTRRTPVLTPPTTTNLPTPPVRSKAAVVAATAAARLPSTCSRPPSRTRWRRRTGWLAGRSPSNI
jgi:hypothetical protein